MPVGFRLDNLRWAPDGSLLAAGQEVPALGIATSRVSKIDPNTLNVREVVRYPYNDVFSLSTGAIQVGQECSGIRSSWVLFITSLVAANLFLKSSWRRALLVGFVIPLGIIRNGFRVFVIGMLCVHFGPQMIHSIIHRQGGPMFFALSLIPLFLLLWWLRRGEQRKQRPEDRDQMKLNPEAAG